MELRKTSNFIISEQDQPLISIKSFLGKAADEVLLIVPYIQVQALKDLQLNQNLKITIITTLKLNDLVLGASDIKLYPYAKSKSIHIFYNNRVHLKAYVRDWQECIVGSSNLSMRGMGMSNNHNYELSCVAEELDTNTLCYLRKILHESKPMTDEIYDYVKEKFDSAPKPESIEALNLPSKSAAKDFLISSLPMSRSVKRLFELGASDFVTDDLEERNCALHDTILFGLNYDTSFEEFSIELSNSFRSNKFVFELLGFIGKQGRYFGEVKEWIQKKCEDTPVPSRRDLTGNIQVLYGWIVDLSDGEFLVDRPNHSERIIKVK